MSSRDLLTHSHLIQHTPNFPGAVKLSKSPPTCKSQSPEIRVSPFKITGQVLFLKFLFLCFGKESTLSAGWCAPPTARQFNSPKFETQDTPTPVKSMTHGLRSERKLQMLPFAVMTHDGSFFFLPLSVLCAKNFFFLKDSIEMLPVSSRREAAEKEIIFVLCRMQYSRYTRLSCPFSVISTTLKSTVICVCV